MNYVLSDVKVSRFWDYPEHKIDDNTPQQIKDIVEFRKKAFNKVLTCEWTEQEFNKFSNVIKKITVNRFCEYIDIFMCLLEISEKEVKKEITNLEKKNLILTNGCFLYTERLGNLIYSIQSKLFFLSNLYLTEDEKNHNQTLEEKIRVNEDVLEQMKNPESDYYKLYRQIINGWVKNTFKNKQLQRVILNKRDTILIRKEKNINQYLKKLYVERNKKSTCVIYQHEKKRAEAIKKEKKVRH